MRRTTLIVIPYWAKGAQGHELELAVTGWRRYFMEPYHIVVVGDYHPIVDVGRDISFIECPQIQPVPGQYLPHLDHVHKFREVRKYFPKGTGFVYTCDDIYPTGFIKLEDIKKPKYPERGFFFQPFKWQTKTPDWYSDKGKTRDLCTQIGIPPRNWVCHLPVYYEWDKLFNIYDQFDCDHVSYIVENIYFNMEYPREVDAVCCLDYRDEVKESYPRIRPAGTVKWITNANSGWSEDLERILKRHYGIL